MVAASTSSYTSPRWVTSTSKHHRKRGNVTRSYSVRVTSSVSSRFCAASSSSSTGGLTTNAAA